MVTVKNPTDSRRFYIGVRSCKVNPEEDYYFGSSKHFCKWQTINGKDGLVKQVLATWPTRKEAVQHEMLLHDCFDIPRNNEFWNRSKQKSNGFDTSGTSISFEHRQKISISQRGKKRDPSVGAKISKAKTGKKRSLETIEKMRLAVLGTKKGPSSEEKKRKLSEKLKGRKWYNNGVDLKLCVEGTQPSGWVVGDPIRKKDFALGKKWYTNGDQQILVLPENAPSGWVLGRLNKKGIENGI
jgi:hypothetical protein